MFEAVAEDLDIKRRVFARLDRAAPPTALLLSNTSSLAISEIAMACQRPERVALAHWILPPHLIPVVEVAPGPRTSPDTIRAVRALLERLDKWPVVLERELPGYLINRLQFALCARRWTSSGRASPQPTRSTERFAGQSRDACP